MENALFTADVLGTENTVQSVKQQKVRPGQTSKHIKIMFSLIMTNGLKPRPFYKCASVMDVYSHAGRTLTHL